LFNQAAVANSNYITENPSRLSIVQYTPQKTNISRIKNSTNLHYHYQIFLKY